MVTDRAHLLAVGRLRKPHGLKGECAVFPLTAEPDAVLAPGKTIWLVDLAGEEVTGPLKIARSRGYHRQWLVTFEGYEDRGAVEPWGGLFLAVPETEVAPPAEDEVWLHELAGFAVQDSSGVPLGLVTAALELPAGVTLEVQGPKREFLLPFRKEFVREVDRDGRRLVVELPEGLLDL
jgi:16S rRNA processing protein RimM